MEFQIGELSEEHQEYNRYKHTHTHTHTHTHMHTHAEQKRQPAAEAVKNAHMSQKCISFVE